MRHSCWSKGALISVLFSLVFIIGSQTVASQPPRDKGVSKRALLIGINKYQAVPRLQGSLNDIETMKRILVTRWGFPEQNIRFLKDDQATREGILKALKDFVSETGSQDTVYIHYSGHGSQVEDLNGDEPDGLDETLVPQDGRMASVTDITDDELDEIFARLPTKNALIVLDSCHSGTATRSVGIRTRSVPQDMRVDLYRKNADGGVRTRGNIQMLQSNYVLMTGAASNQEALDGPIEGRYHGFFTYALSKSLSAAPSMASPPQILRGVELELKRIQTHFGRTSMPEPQLEAPPDLLEAPLLGTTTTDDGNSRLAWLAVQGAENGTVTFVNGLILGTAIGSTWAIYPPTETTFKPGKALAVATVTQLDGQNAKAKYQPPSQTISDQSRAVALMPAPNGAKIPIQIIDVDGPQKKQIAETLTKYLPTVELVGSEQTARYLVTLKDHEIQLLAADGLQLVAVFGSDKDNWGAGLAVVVARSATASELLTLDNPSSQIKIDVRVTNAPPQNKPKVSPRGVAVVAAETQPARYRIRKPGKPRTAENTLQLEVKVSADSYITIVDVDSEGGVNLLFPNDYAKPNFYPDGFVKGGTPVLIPDSLNDSNRAGFHWDYSPPKGMDTVRVFSSTDLQTANLVRQQIRSLQQSTSNPPGKMNTRGIAENIGSLRAGLEERTVRGIVTVYDSTPHIPGTTSGANTSTEISPSQTEAKPEPLTQPSSQTTTQLAKLGDSGPPPDWAATSITIKVEN